MFPPLLAGEGRVGAYALLQIETLINGSGDPPAPLTRRVNFRRKDLVDRLQPWHEALRNVDETVEVQRFEADNYFIQVFGGPVYRAPPAASFLCHSHGASNIAIGLSDHHVSDRQSRSLVADRQA